MELLGTFLVDFYRYFVLQPSPSEEEMQLRLRRRTTVRTPYA